VDSDIMEALPAHEFVHYLFGHRNFLSTNEGVSMHLCGSVILDRSLSLSSRALLTFPRVYSAVK